MFTAGCLPLLELGESDLGVMAKECAARGVGGTFADCIMRQQARGISGAYAHAGGGGAAEEEEEEEVANQTQKQKEGALSAKAAEWELKKAGREAGRQAKEREQARLRAEIFKSVNDESTPPPPPAPETQLINELIREYLDYQGYHATRSGFLPETGQPAAPMDRTLIADQLKIREDSVSERVPMMYSVVGAHRDGLGFGGGGAPRSPGASPRP